MNTNLADQIIERLGLQREPLTTCSLACSACGRVLINTWDGQKMTRLELGQQFVDAIDHIAGQHYQPGSYMEWQMQLRVRPVR